MSNRLKLFCLWIVAVAALAVREAPAAVSASANHKSIVEKRVAEKMRSDPKYDLQKAEEARSQRREKTLRELETMRKLDFDTVNAYAAGKITREQALAGVRAEPAPNVRQAPAGTGALSPARRRFNWIAILSILVVALVWKVLKDRKGGE